jgi:hypothetical protein
MSPFAIRIGAGAGSIAFIGVLVGLIAIPIAIAGQPPTSASDPSVVRAYFAHPQLSIFLGLVQAFTTVAVIAFGIGLRSAIRSDGDERGRVAADTGLALLTVASALYLVSGALAVALVDAATRDAGEFPGLFRLYDVLYNGMADVFEGAWIGAFSLAMLAGQFPRWLGWLGVAVGLSRWAKALAPFVALPGVLAILSGVLFLVWFLGTVVVLSRLAMRRSRSTPVSIATA